MTVLRKETPVRDLPRFRRDPVVEAERQGFDDGYFGNEEVTVGAYLEQEARAYCTGFEAGKAQRPAARKAKK